MKPGIFAASGEADEIWLHRATKSAELEALLTRHRDTYITEADFRNIAAHGYLVMAEQFPLFRLIPDRWLMGWYRLFVRWNERRIRRAARYAPVIVGEWCVANGLVNRVVDKHSGDGGRSEENAMHSTSIRGSIYREVAAMQRKAWSASAGQIYWSYQLRGNHDFLPTIDPQSDTSRLDPWDFTHVWHAGWMV